MNIRHQTGLKKSPMIWLSLISVCDWISSADTALRGRVAGVVLIGCLAVARVSLGQDSLQIEIWYGDQQRFGSLGHPQKWVNVLGHVSPADQVAELTHTINGSPARPLSFREDMKRIARDGDFNIEIDRKTLVPGKNTVSVVATHKNGSVTRRRIEVVYVDHGRSWPLPYVIDWSKVDRIQDVAQVIDGKWKLTDRGVRTVERYYDRVIAVGDSSWKNVEVTTTVTIHALTGPDSGPNNTNVTHAAIALRWPGHDADGKQPSVKWYPLGATAEFRLGGDLKECRWRIFDGKREFHVESTKRRTIELETAYRMKHRVETLDNGQSRYRAKLWPAGAPEPSDWDLERLEAGDLTSGSALLIAHHSDVTFGNVTVIPID